MCYNCKCINYIEFCKNIHIIKLLTFAGTFFFTLTGASSDEGSSSSSSSGVVVGGADAPLSSSAASSQVPPSPAGDWSFVGSFSLGGGIGGGGSLTPSTCSSGDGSILVPVIKKSDRLKT